MDKETPGYTYADLRRVHIGRLEEEQKSLQQIRNHTSTLQLFMRAIGKHDSDNCVDDFNISFEDRLCTFLSWSNEQGVNASTTANRISSLRSIALTLSTCEDALYSSEGFTSALQALLDKKNITRHELARITGVNGCTIRTWLDGRFPAEKSMSDVRKIDKALGSESGVLQRILLKSRVRELPPCTRETEWRKTFKKRLRQTYAYNKPSQLIADEWASLVDFHTAPYLINGLQRNSVWRVKPRSRITLPMTWGGECKSGFCVTAQIHWHCFSLFFGYLLMDKKDGGMSFSSEQLSIALASDAQLVAGFIEFRRQRSGSYTSGSLTDLNLFKAMLRKETGFLWQQPLYGERLPSPVAAENWAAWCEQSYETLKAIIKGLKSGGHIRLGRDPKEPIQDILAAQHPIQVIVDMTKRMEKYNYFERGERKKAVRKRDILIIKMLISNPLRVHHYSIMTYREDNTGNLYRGERDEWRLRFTPDDFKNHKGAAKSGYDVTLSAWLTKDIDSYISTYRQCLYGAAETDVLFLPANQTGKLANTGMYMKASLISNKIRMLTKRYIPNCPGFSAHAFRHIVATDFIKNNPNGFQVAASILHDQLETVMKAYAHIKVADGFAHWTSYFDAQVEAVEGGDSE